VEQTVKTLNYQVRLPEHTGDVADKEHFFLTKNGQDGQEQKVLLHDYTVMYQNPGLYEYLCYQYLSYQAPRVLASLLIEQLTQAQEAVSEIQLLDLAAGSGLTARELAALGVESITGIDLYPEAGEAAQRESPDLYENYYVEDLAHVKKETSMALSKKGFNCLVCCSALPALPASAFVTAFNIIRPNAWIAFNVLKEIWEDSSAEGFFARHPWAVDRDVFELREQMYSLRRYTTHGRPLEEIIVVGTKKGNVV
jgi:2-polyprenyl-3-methyl-5-hydroxy-6-metoxy-1,4-benzoquinol methylase